MSQQENLNEIQARLDNVSLKRLPVGILIFSTVRFQLQMLVITNCVTMYCAHTPSPMVMKLG